MGKIVGYRPPDVFAEKMEEIVRVHRELPTIEARYEENPQDLATGALLAVTYASRGDTRKAKRYVKAVEEVDPDNRQGHLTEAYLAMGDAYEAEREFRNAAKVYAKVTKSSNDSAILADARFNTARAHFMDRTRLKPASKGLIKKLEEAKAELDALLVMEDLSEEHASMAKDLLKAVNDAHEEATHQWEEARKEKRKGRKR